MKDLGAARKSIVVFLLLATMLGCGALGAGKRSGNALVLSNPSLDFGTVVVGGSKVVAENILNATDSDVTVTQASVSGTELQIDGTPFPLTLAANQSATFSITFVPKAKGNLSGAIAISSTASRSAIAVSVSGLAVNPGQLSVVPSLISFGGVPVGKSQTKSAALTNSGGSDLTLSQVTVNSSEFQVSGLSLPVTLPAGQNTTFNVTFTPKASGSQSGMISVTTSASLNPPKHRNRAPALTNVSFTPSSPHSDNTTTVTIPLTGSGTTPGQLTLTPGNLSFGNVQVGNNQTLSETLTNSGGSDVTVSQAAVTGPGFNMTGVNLPMTVSAGQSKSFSVTFAPSSAGGFSGNVAIVSDAATPVLNATLSGTGVTPGSLSPSPGSLSFGSVQVGNSQSLSETLTNSGGSSVTITQATVTGAGYTVSGLSLPATLPAGQSTTFSVKFAPSSGGLASGNLSITSDASNPSLSIPLSGTGVTPGSLAPNPGSLSFGSVQVGNSQSLSETLTNSGGSSVTISQATVTGAGYTVSGLSLPATLPAGQSTTFSVKFAPSAGGSSNGNLSITSDASNPNLSIPLSGTGVTPGALAPSPGSLSFGSVQVGNSQSLSETLTNSGGSSVTISQANATGAGYSVTGLTLPTTLGAGQSTSFGVKFAPSAGGSAPGNLSITSDASNPSLNIPLSGTGVTPGSLTANPTSLSFGSVQVGSSQTLSGTLTNSGGSSITISQATITGAGYTVSGLSLPATLPAGQSATFSVKFAPSSGGSASGNLSITSDASNPSLSIPLSGTGVTPGSLAPNPGSLSFGNVQVGNSQSLSETLTNSGGSSVTITQVTVTGAAYSVSGLSLPATLGAGQSTTFSVKFAPSAGGSSNGNLSITSDASNPNLSIPLSGTGVTPGALAPSPGSLSFGSVQVGNSQSLSETLTNSGGSSVTISQANATGAGYSVTGLTLPVTLPAGQSASFSVKFAPSSGGSASGNLSITSDASNPSLSIPLSGTGVTPGSLAPSPGSLSFGSVQVGNSQSLAETLTNSGGSSLTITQATVTGSAYTVSGLSLPVTLGAGQSTSFSVKFAPSSGGSASGNLSITSDASNPSLSIPLSGIGVTPGSLTANPTSLSFGNVQVGNTQTLSETLTNSGGSSVTISQATVTGAGYSVTGLTLPATLGAGQSTTFSVKFAPSAGGSAPGSLSITSDASNPSLSIPLSGTGVTPGSLAANPASLSFGNVQVGSSQTLSETLTNSGGSSLTITQATATGPGFSISGLSLPLTLIAGQSFTFGAVFAPTAAGSTTGNIAIVSNASNPNLAIALAGVGTVIGQLTVTPATLSFGSVVVGQSKSLTATLSATGSSVTVSSATTGTSEFALSGLSFPVTIPAGQSASLTVTFTPQASGAASDSISFSSNASNTPTESLTGNGTAPPQHSADLSWTASTSSVVGYNVYRSNVSGKQYTKMNSVLDASTSYTDSTVLAGHTYFYVTTAVDANGVESAKSNEVQAVIPTP